MVSNGFQHVVGLGNFPSDWLVTSADEVTEKITKGTTPPKSEIVDDKKIPFLRVNNLGFTGSLNSNSEMLFVTEDAHKGFLSRSIAYPNDILMNIVGPPLGKIAILGDEYPEYNMNQAVLIYRCKEQLIDNGYFLSFLASELAQQWLQSRSKKTSGQQNLTIQLCKELPTPVPPLPEQRKIAKILGTWAKAISNTEKLIETSKQQKKALMQQLLTGKKRLVDPKTGKTFEGEWKNVSLKKLISEVKKTKEAEPNKVELLTVKLHHKGVKASGKYPNATKGGRPYYKRNKGELIIGRQNLHNGGIAIVTEECDGLIASNAISSFEVTSSANVQFILNKMSTAHFIYTIDNLTGGTGQKEISVKELLKIKISVPSIKEQQKIASVLTAADKEIEVLEAKLAHFKQEKKALMQQLLTGKRRVKVDEEVAA
jgi:type I restriction enzyme S subunit